MASLWDWQWGLYESAVNLFGQETTRQAEDRRAARSAEYERIRRELAASGLPDDQATMLADHWLDECRRDQAEHLGWVGGVRKFRDNLASTGKPVGGFCAAVGAGLGVLCPPAGAIVSIVGVAVAAHGEIEFKRAMDELKRRQRLQEKLTQAKRDGDAMRAEQAALEYQHEGGDPQWALEAASYLDSGQAIPDSKIQEKKEEQRKEEIIQPVVPIDEILEDLEDLEPAESGGSGWAALIVACLIVWSASNA